MRIEDTTVCDCGNCGDVFECPACHDYVCKCCGTICEYCDTYYHFGCLATQEDYTYNLCGDCVEKFWDNFDLG